MKAYLNEMSFYYNRYKNTWKSILQKQLTYKNINFVNVKHMNLIDRQDVPLYVFPVFMGSGIQKYVVKKGEEFFPA
jgi:hypothetical protein